MPSLPFCQCGREVLPGELECNVCLTGGAEGNPFLYGDDRTVHRTQHLNIEVSKKGEVVSVWFRCMPLPFEVTRVDEKRAEEMRKMYNLQRYIPNLLGVKLSDRAEEAKLA